VVTLRAVHGQGGPVRPTGEALLSGY